MSFNKMGSFLVRDDKTALGNFLLSIRDQERVRHYHIRRFENSRFFLTRRAIFNTIQDLVEFYKVQADGLCCPPPQTPTASVDKPGYTIYVGKYDYESRTDDDLSFKKGDLMYIISTDDKDWWFAQSKDTGKEGYIPSNHVAEWKSLDAEE